MAEQESLDLMVSGQLVSNHTILAIVEGMRARGYFRKGPQGRKDGLVRSTPICTQRINRGGHSAQIKTTPSHKRYARSRQRSTGAPCAYRDGGNACGWRRLPSSARQCPLRLEALLFSLRVESRTWPDCRVARIAYAAAAPRFTSLPHHDLRRACTSVLNVSS